MFMLQWPIILPIVRVRVIIIVIKRKRDNNYHACALFYDFIVSNKYAIVH